MSKNSPEDLLDDDSNAFVEPGQRRPRRANPFRLRRPKRSHGEIMRSITERDSPAQLNGGLTFGPSLDATSVEREWIHEYLDAFYQGKVITGVLRRVKGGKEATVYCCTAHPEAGVGLIAAKLYRPRLFRSLRNDLRYRQGRPILGGDGMAVSLKRRERLALDKHTRFGRELEQTSWLEYEYQTLQRLYAAGVDVPRPLKHGANTILMEFVGDEAMPAPALIEVTLAQAEARPVFERLMRDVEVMLACQCVHGDLSAYNVLYWEGEVRIIDFPQVVDPRLNPEARAIFQRDVDRLCQYFARYGVRADAAKMANEIWRRYASAPRDALEGDPGE